MHTCLMRDHQMVMIKFMYVKNIVYLIKYSHYKVLYISFYMKVTMTL